MKKILSVLYIATLLFASCSDEYDDSALTGRVDNLENRVAKLEELCKQMNTNISSLQTIVTALQKNDYVTNVTPIMQNGKEVGYTITFSKSNPIYNRGIQMYRFPNSDVQKSVIFEGIKKRLKIV